MTQSRSRKRHRSSEEDEMENAGLQHPKRHSGERNELNPAWLPNAKPDRRHNGHLGSEDSSSSSSLGSPSQSTNQQAATSNISQSEAIPHQLLHQLSDSSNQSEEEVILNYYSRINRVLHQAHMERLQRLGTQQPDSNDVLR
ncbi:PREDICTED: uncharacterized protein LOC109485637 [Branchiostoma belcheri]|uniref:Uncharacterized protein LOC109485637 n=1 Tax=Branchiostoma belcheri TaxID=7741 RepID=A0A6P5AEX8_BRABE|nr:PREDICTED: uncharacterized protein LOC109485637 [Branchiostoma belcheri]